MIKPKKQHPVTEVDIQQNCDQAEEEEYKLFQLEQDAQMEAQWLASREARTLDPPLGYILSCQDPYGVYTPDGRKIGSTCHCEDYPCCGH